MYDLLYLYSGMTAMSWLLLQLLTTRESRAICPKNLARMTTWIYLVMGAVISALLIYLPILITGTLCVTGILIAMFLHRFQRNAALNVVLLADASMTKSIGNNQVLLKNRAVLCNRARQNYGLITMVNNGTYVMSIMVGVGLGLAVLVQYLPSN